MFNLDFCSGASVSENPVVFAFLSMSITFCLVLSKDTFRPRCASRLQKTLKALPFVLGPKGEFSLLTLSVISVFVFFTLCPRV